MARIILSLVCWAHIVCAQQAHSAPGPAAPAVAANPDVLKTEDAVALLTLQRDQLRKYGELEHGRADMLQAEKDLAAINAKLQRVIAEIQQKYSCPSCQISDDMQLIRPIPTVVTTTPNK